MKKKKKINIEKSFVPLKNNLKYIKDKDERVTKSYLLALGMTSNQNKNEKIEEKEKYMPTASVIEEEKSDLVESKSELSNKKINIKNTIFCENSLNPNNNNNKNRVMLVKNDNKIKIINIVENDKKEKKMKKIENGGEKTNYINVNRNYKNIIGKRNENNLKDKEKLSLRMSIALNEIINKNNKKEENKRIYLKKNKTNLLNSFFNLTYKGKKIKKNEINNYNQKNENTEIFKNSEKNIVQDKRINKKEINFPLIQKRKSEKINISNIIKIRYNTDNSDSMRSINCNISQNKINSSNIIYNDESRNMNNNVLNNGINSYADMTQTKNNTLEKDENKSTKRSNLIITKIEYRQKSRIPHIRQKIIDKKESNNINNKFNNINNCTISKYSAPNKKYLKKILNIPHKKTYSFTKENNIYNNRKDYDLQSLKQMKAINEALAIIRIGRINSKSIIKSNSKKYNLSFNKNKNSNSSSFTRATRSNSKSSRSKEKKILVNKTNSGSLNYKNELSFLLLEESNNINISNKKQTIITLKENLIYSKSYMKNNVLEKIIKTFNSDNSFFILYCEKYIKVDNNDKGNDNNCNNTNKNDFILLFKSLMKYYQNQNRFIKISGEENAPNVISVKNIDINNYYIYRTKSIEKKDKNDISLFFESIKELQFTTNAIILCKK